MHRTRVIKHREETEYKDDNPKPHRERIHSDTENPGQVEGAPDEHAGLGGVVEMAAGADGAGAAPVEEEAFDDYVGKVEARYAEGDDVVEGGGGSDVD